MTIRRTFATLTLVILTAAGCGGDDNPTGLSASCGTLGSFSGNATGVGAGALAGCSFYNVSQSSNGTFFGLSLVSGNFTTFTHSVTLARSGGRPPAGTYNVGTGTSDMTGTVFVDAGDRSFFLTSGTITITTSASDNLVGSLNVTGTELGGSATISVTGNFAAKCQTGSGTGVTFSC